MMDLLMGVLVTVVALVFVVAGVILFIKVRPKFPAVVNCWFCDKNTKVPYENRNDWNCPYCDQYNGFSSDGGYSKIIHAQYESRLNRPVTVCKEQVYYKPRANKFCRSCTINQELKIQQLASFIPIDEDNFEEEIEQYRIHLERAYALCPSCESVLKDTLTRQTAWLLGLKAKEKCQSYLQGRRVYNKLLAAACSNVELARALSATICFIMLAGVVVNEDYAQIPPSLTTVLSSVPLPHLASELFEWLLLCHQSTHLAAAGLMFQAFAALCAGTNCRTHELCAIAGWLLLQLQYWTPFKGFIHTEDISLFCVVTLLATLIFCILPFLIPRMSKSTLKKIQSDSYKRSDSPLHTAYNVQAKERSEDLTVNKYMNFNAESPLFANKCAPEMGSQKKVFNAAAPCRTQSNRGHKQRTSDESCLNANSVSGSHNGFQNAKCYSVDTYFERDLHHGLDSLSLGTGRRPQSRRWAFETRIYGCKEFPGLFSATDKRPRPLLSPPRFGVHKNVTRSPWSAGGYWQTPQSFADGHDGSPLSRSSSRSSGFGSMSSRPAVAYDTAAAAAVAASLPGSRAGSVCAGDADRFSVHSLPAYPPNFPPTYFPFYGAPYLVPHIGGYAVPPPYCFSGPPMSPSPQSSPALSDSDSSCASQKAENCASGHKGFIDILRGNAWLSFLVGSSLLLNAVATVFFIFTSRSFLTSVP